MYTIHVGTRAVFCSLDKRASKRVYDAYKKLYAWGQDAVRVTYAPKRNG